MHLKSVELVGFKSFGKKTRLEFTSSISSIVGPNGSGKSNVAEAFRFVLGEQSMKSLRSKKGEDLIWGGSPALPRQNRAAVTVTFDNSSRFLDLDFSEVVIERVVHRDGQNEYRMNGSPVRLKDVIRLLAGANIGGSGYHIISQGQADHILNAPPRERREMVEDALGLKLYQHKKAESERKLAETAQNIEKTRSLRRELAPHLKFLGGQVEKIEKAREMKDELGAKLVEYLSREHAWVTQEHARLSEHVREMESEVRALESKLAEVRSLQSSAVDQADTGKLARLETLQRELSAARRHREEIVRELGRAEGALEAAAVTVEHVVPAPHVREFMHEIDDALERVDRADPGDVRGIIESVRGRIRAFVDGLKGAAPVTNEEARRDVSRLSENLSQAEKEEVRLSSELESLRSELTKAREVRFSAERDEVEARSKLREAQTRLIAVRGEREHVVAARQRFEEEVREGILLAGAAIAGWDRTVIPEGALSEDRREQEKRRREIERLKIKIEEAGIGGSEAILREYEETRKRDEFLARELVDLETSSESLANIIRELERTIDERFAEGLTKINEALGGFFAKLFGGGDARLYIEEPRVKTRGAKEEGAEDEMIEEEEEELYAGLSISVSLPRKKIRGLEILSGGERALTSIALIFAMTQVNPPPFLILDETDAALDEANSRRYADMIRELGKRSQLIVITHNRATMAAAGELYGVTMGADGVSMILSVKLSDAEKVAK
jgi:chromosome segregation protein